MMKFLKIFGFLLNGIAVVSPKLAGKIGMKLFCFPYRKKMKKGQVEFLNKAKDKTFKFEGETVVQYKWGSGPTKVLMVHGWQSHSYRWKRYLEKMDKSKFTIYAIDAPGHGLSTGHQLNVPIFGKLIHQLISKGLKVDILMGHSIGGFSSLYTISEFPNESLSKLVILASPGDAMDFMEIYRELFGFNKKVEESMQALLRSIYGVDLHYFKAHKFAANIKVPGLIIHDQYDPECPVAYAKEMHDNWNGSRLVLTKGMGHRLTDDQSINEVVKFIEA